MKKTKLLLIDDERPLLNNLKQILEFEDFDVVTAGNGKEGLTQYEKERPDMVICDIMMPEMDGYGFIKNLRIKGFTDTPFIFLTAKSDYDDLRTGMSFGADDYLVKPVKSAQLLEAINIRLQRKREITKKVEVQLTQIENGFRLITDQEFFASIYDIIGYLQLLKTKHSQLDNESVQEYLGFMERSTNRLLSLLRKIKNWHEQERVLILNNNYNEIPVVHIKELLTNAAKGTAKLYQRERDLLCDIAEDACLKVNKGLVETLFNELLENAFKFSQKGNPIAINTSIKEGNYIILIADCGKTTNAETLIGFKPLHNNDRLPDNDPGVGLGLAIANLAIKSLNGKISFEDNSPCGILVKVSIPIILDDTPAIEKDEAEFVS